jgi:predicted ATPase
MPDQTPYHFVTTALDTKLLFAGSRIRTNWYVISGAPCCGKTTLIDQLAARGFKTVPEAGRQYIEQEFSKGRGLEEIRKDKAVFNRCLLDLTLEIEQRLDPDELLFLDRGLAECVSFHRIIGLNPNEILAECTQFQYAAVFVLDRFPLQKDGVRTEDNATSDFLDEWLERDYRTMEYRVVRVPVLSFSDRMEFVLDRLSSRLPAG